MMRDLSRDMDDLVDTCRCEIPRVFEGNDYTHRIEEVIKEVQVKRQAMTTELEQEVKRIGFGLTFSQVEITPVPLTEGRTMTQEEFGQLADSVRAELNQRAGQLRHSIGHTMLELKRLNKETAESTMEVDTELVRFTLTPIIDELKAKFTEYPAVVNYLYHVETDMVEHLDIFKPMDESEQASTGLPGALRD